MYLFIYLFIYSFIYVFMYVHIIFEVRGLENQFFGPPWREMALKAFVLCGWVRGHCLRTFLAGCSQRASCGEHVAHNSARVVSSMLSPRSELRACFWCGAGDARCNRCTRCKSVRRDGSWAVGLGLARGGGERTVSLTCLARPCLFGIGCRPRA